MLCMRIRRKSWPTQTQPRHRRKSCESAKGLGSQDVGADDVRAEESDQALRRCGIMGRLGKRKSRTYDTFSAKSFDTILGGKVSAAASTADVSSQASSISDFDDYCSAISKEDFRSVCASPACDRIDIGNMPQLTACSCGHLAHRQHDPAFPLTPAAKHLRGGFEEMVTICRVLEGHWVTVLERSENMDDQFRHLGISVVKRAVLNRISMALTFFLEKDDTMLHLHLHTPMGIRHMAANLQGESFKDEDPDVGIWEGTARVVDYYVPWLCSSPVRAFQQTRSNQKVGTIIETRVVLPDDALGRVALINFTLIPWQGGGKAASTMRADRILRYVGKPPPNAADIR
eukprot:GHVU01055268.1.p1 GENE.GHVU01055268.1~~GHVU01055268.1.p1  ORF type:complete len:344 (+),score=41.45 GHVU01055268.1:268-1299(+)